MRDRSIYDCGPFSLANTGRFVIAYFVEARVVDGRILAVACEWQRCPCLDHTGRVDEIKELAERDEAGKDPCIIVR